MHYAVRSKDEKVAAIDTVNSTIHYMAPSFLTGVTTFLYKNNRIKIIYFALLMIVSFRVSATPPTTPATNLSFNAIDGGFFNIGWTPGNGAGRILICKAGSAVTFIPRNGIDYASSDVFGSGEEVVPGEFVVYDNAFTSFFLTGLTVATYSYFICAPTSCYIICSPDGVYCISKLAI
jgi:hypothetical protein